MPELYHISEEADIKTFIPRPSPQQYASIKRNVVFAVSANRLHNYLLPRNCPRVTFYATAQSTPKDIDLLIGPTKATFIIAVEKESLPAILNTNLYKYQFAPHTFKLLDENAGYYISYNNIKPVSVIPIYNILEELMKADVELRIVPNLHPLAEAVVQSTLSFSLIRMKFAKSLL